MKITELRSLIREAVKAQLKEAKMSKEKIEGLIWSLENEIRPWHPSDNSKKKAMLDKLKKKLSKFESGIKESKQLKEYSGDSGLEELVDTLGYSDVMEFFEDNSGAVDAVYKWAESIPSFKQKMKQSGMYESSLKEAITANKSITTQQATKIADRFAKYMSSKENKRFTVTKGSVEGPSFDLDVDGFEYEGGSYIIDTKGDIINVAMANPEVYGNISMLESTIATRMKIKEANKKK